MSGFSMPVLAFEMNAYFFSQAFSMIKSDNNHKEIAIGILWITLFLLPPLIIMILLHSSMLLFEEWSDMLSFLIYVGDLAFVSWYMAGFRHYKKVFNVEIPIHILLLFGYSSLALIIPILYKTTNLSGPPIPIHLSVKNIDLVPDTVPETTDVSIRLRGRQLPHIELDGSDLHRADFSEANIEDASFKGARLDHSLFKSVKGSKAVFDEADMRYVDFSLSNLQGASFVGTRTRLDYAKFNAVIGYTSDYKKKIINRTNLNNTNFYSANLDHTELKQADMQSVILSDAQLQYVNLTNAQMRNAEMFFGTLYKTDLSDAVLTRMRFYGVNVIDSKWKNIKTYAGRLESSNIFNSNFDEAKMQGMDLSGSKIINVSMKEADLQGANLSHTLLFDSKVWWETNLSGANFTGAIIWNCDPPGEKYLKHVDLSQIRIERPDSEFWSINYQLDKIHDQTLAEKLKNKYRTILTSRKAKRWKRSRAYRTWKRLKKRHTPKDRLAFIDKRTRFLADLICESKLEKNLMADNIIAGGILDQIEKNGKETDIFLADPVLFRKMLKGCKPGEKLSDENGKKLNELAIKFQAYLAKASKATKLKSVK